MTNKYSFDVTVEVDTYADSIADAKEQIWNEIASTQFTILHEELIDVEEDIELE